MLCENDVSAWSSFKVEQCNELLVKAMTEIVAQAGHAENLNYSIFYTNDASNRGQMQDTTDASTSQESSSKNVTNTTAVEGKLIIESQTFHSQLRYIFSWNTKFSCCIISLTENLIHFCVGYTWQVIFKKLRNFLRRT